MIVIVNAKEIIGSAISDDGTEVGIRFRKADGGELVVSIPFAELTRFVETAMAERNPSRLN